MNKKEFERFFADYSKNVDRANDSFFWQLSDDLIMTIIREHIPSCITNGQIIFDAGGGTGRWVCIMSDVFKANFILYDLSDDMLAKAEINIRDKKIKNRVRIIKGDLTNIKDIKDKSIDYIVSIYSPISFINKKEKAAKEMHRILKKGGRAIIMGHSFFNALASKINTLQSGIKELHLLNKESKVKWASHVPKLNIFSKETMEKMLKQIGFRVIKTYGVPVFVQPGPEDWDPKNKKISDISKSLSNTKLYKKVFELEKKYNYLDDVVNRGMNIISVVQK